MTDNNTQITQSTSSSSSSPLTLTIRSFGWSDLELVCPNVELAILEVRTIKYMIQRQHPAHPPITAQRLVYDGRLLLNDEDVATLFAFVAPGRRVIHLAIRPNLQPNSTPTSTSTSTSTHSIDHNETGNFQQIHHSSSQTQTINSRLDQAIQDDEEKSTGDEKRSELVESIDTNSASSISVNKGSQSSSASTSTSTTSMPMHQPNIRCHPSPIMTNVHMSAFQYPTTYPTSSVSTYYPYSYPSAFGMPVPFPSLPSPYGSSSPSPSSPIDSFGIRHRHVLHGTSSNSSSSSLTDSHAQALAAYQSSLAQYHAMISAWQSQFAAATMAASGSGSHPTPLNVSLPLHPYGWRNPSFPMASQPFNSPLSAAPLLSSASASVPSSSSAPPPNSILAALTRSSTPSQQQSALSHSTSSREDLRSARVREAIQALTEYTAMQHNAMQQQQQQQHQFVNDQPVGGVGIPAPAPAANPLPQPVAGAVAGGGAAAVGQPAAPAPLRHRLARYFDLRLLLKFIVLFILFSQDGDWQRTILLGVAAVLAYLYQVGAFGRGPPANPPINGLDEDEMMMQEFQQAHGGGGFGGNQIQPPPRQQQPPQQQQRQQQQEVAAADPANGGVGVGVALNGEPAPAFPVGPPPAEGFIPNVEKFIVGFFASLVPTWRPTPVPPAQLAPIPQPQQQPQPQPQPQRQANPPEPEAHVVQQ